MSELAQPGTDVRDRWFAPAAGAAMQLFGTDWVHTQTRWFEPGKRIVVRNAPTFFGKISLETEGHLPAFELASHGRPAFTPGRSFSGCRVPCAASQSAAVVEQFQRRRDHAA
ncbi:MAG: hypothetical protein DMG57_38600 [Acidobacteria bacterium]|nr:MAG: hypothetical protein DMG57_38600 [Acidobacteriota bacterium]